MADARARSILYVPCIRYLSEGVKGSDVVDISALIVYCISTVNTQHMQRPDVLVQLGYIWRHVSAVKRPSSG